MRLHRGASWVLALAAAGCTAGTEEPGAVGIVLLDREARAAGQLSHEGWHGAPALPVSLDAGEPVAFSSPAGRVVFDLRPGAIAYLHGAGGAIEWLRLGEDVGADRLRVHATKEVAADLAKRLAGRVESGADGVFTITAPDLFERASFLEAPAGITDVVPDYLGAMQKGDRSSGSFAIPDLERVAALPEGASEAARQAMLVGVYTAGNDAIILDADGGFTLEDACSGDPIDRGRYHTEGDRIVLGVSRSERVLIWDSGGLRDPAGVRFAPLMPPEPKAALEEGGEP